MKKSLSILLLTLIGFHFFAAQAAEEKKTSYFVIGNSLTWDTVPPLLDGDVQWHVDCGKSLPYILEHPEKPCVKTSTIWPKALKEKQYNFISMQPHYGSTLDEDAAVISQWVEMQKKAVFIIHTGWAKSASRAEEFSDKDTAGKMHHSPEYFEALLAKLRKLHPKREFRRTRAMDLLAKVAADIEAGKAPFKDITELYRDAIHMNVVTGRYMMHNAMREALEQPRSAKGFEKLNPKLKAYFDGVLDWGMEKSGKVEK